jgi:hypothetical protein
LSKSWILVRVDVVGRAAVDRGVNRRHRAADEREREMLHRLDRQAEGL